MKISDHSSLIGSPSDQAFADSPLGRRLLDIDATGSVSNRAIADYLLRNPVRVTAWSIEDLAATIGVSTATLSRFARMVGFNGYATLRSAVAETLQSILQPVEKLRTTFDQGRGDAPLLAEGLGTTIGNVRAASEGLSRQTLAPIIDLLTTSRTVYVMGFGLSAHVAAILTLGLQPFCNALVNVVEFGGTEVAAGRLLNIGKGDVLIVISVPRYATDAIHLTTYARDHGADIVAITDSPASPLARLAGHVLLGQNQHPVLSSSLVPALVIAEALVATFMMSNRQNVIQAAKLTEAISSYLYRPEVAARSPRGGRKTTPRTAKRLTNRMR